MKNKIDFKEKIMEVSGFDYLDKGITVDLKTTLFITHCCANKNPLLSKGKAEELYIGTRNKIFYGQVKNRNIRYCTLSDKCGLIFPDDIIETYNVAPTDLSESDLIALKEKIKEQIPKDIKTIVYYGISPNMTQFYLKMFKDIELEKKFITRFTLINNFKPRTLF